MRFGEAARIVRQLGGSADENGAEGVRPVPPPRARGRMPWSTGRSAGTPRRSAPERCPRAACCGWCTTPACRRSGATGSSPAAKPAARPSAEPDYFLRRRGEAWQLRFAGHEVSVLLPSPRVCLPAGDPAVPRQAVHGQRAGRRRPWRQGGHPAGGRRRRCWTSGEEGLRPATGRAGRGAGRGAAEQRPRAAGKTGAADRKRLLAPSEGRPGSRAGRSETTPTWTACATASRNAIRRALDGHQEVRAAGLRPSQGEHLLGLFRRLPARPTRSPGRSEPVLHAM